MNQAEEKKSMLQEKNRTTTFLLENLQEDVAVSLEEKWLYVCFGCTKRWSKLPQIQQD
jgi:hypothetical protein